MTANNRWNPSEINPKVINKVNIVLYLHKYIGSTAFSDISGAAKDQLIFFTSTLIHNSTSFMVI